MRRHHFLALTKSVERPTKQSSYAQLTSHRLQAHPGSISLLIGAEADRERRRSTQIPPSPREEQHRRLSCQSSATDGDYAYSRAPSESEADTDEPGPGFLGRMNSYNRIMHAHTKSQLQSPATCTLPSYTKTMRAFTLNQLVRHRRSNSESSSRRGSTQAEVILPSKLRMEVEKLSMDDVPHAPSNTPEGQHDVQGLDFRKVKRRSVTEPILEHELNGIKRRDFAFSS